MSAIAGWYSTLNQKIRVAVNSLGELVLAGYQSATNLLRVAEVDPITTHHDEWTIADVTNGADTTHDYFADMDDFAGCGFRWALTDGSGTVTFTLWGSKQDDGTAPASCAYDNITLEICGKASFTGADSPINIDDSAKRLGDYKYLRFRIVANTGATDGAWTGFAKKRNL